jgi:hypothetical protein
MLRGKTRIGVKTDEKRGAGTMYSGKKVLLIAGGGTLGTYVSEEILRLGASVDVICPEPKESHHERLVFHQSLATEEVLSDLFAKNHYNGIVNFLHYKDVEDYKKVHPFLIKNTDHLIFLSSYRVYANEQHPLTESAPRLTEVLDDEEFMENEKYAVPKARCEDYLRQERAGEPWTIVRPVISFSERRFDLLMNSGRQVISIAEKGKEFLMPLNVKDMKAGLDWAGNSGKLIANLLFKPEALGEGDVEDEHVLPENAKYEPFFSGEESVHSHVTGSDLFWGFKENWKKYFTFWHNWHSGIVNDYELYGVVFLAAALVYCILFI